MGLKCSVLGHKYGEATVEREREEQGSEVVITIREQETCERCGNTRIVSENKEVTSIETPSDIAGDVVDAQADADDGAAEHDAVEHNAVEHEASEPAPDDVAADQRDDPVTPVFEEQGDDVESSVDPDADDAEIIESSGDVSSGDAELDEPSTTVDVPDAEDDVAAEADPEEDDALIIDGDDEESSPADDRQPGQWPEEPGDGGDDWKPETVLSDEPEPESEEPDVEPVGNPAVTVPDGEFHCEECGFSTPVESSSLRAGDFCPECHKGSLVQRTGE